MLGVAGYHVPRAFQWNLHSVPLEASEEQTLKQAGITDGVLQRYFAWRRSLLAVVLGPLTLSAVLGTIDTISGFQGMSGFGVIVSILHALSLWAMPVAAFLAFRAWANPRRSRWYVLLGWSIGFCVPFVISLAPIEWSLGGGLTAEQMAGIGAAAGIGYAFMLMPLVMSVMPGMVRAGVRVKTLIPGAILPGWFLLGAVPMTLLVWLVPLSTLNAMTGGLLMVVAMVLFVGAPLWYVRHSHLFTRPCTAAEIARIGPVQKVVGLTALAGIAVLLVYMLTHTLGGKTILGFTESGAVLRPWSLDLHKFIFDYLARSLFMTAVFADVIIRACTRAHKEVLAFHNSPASREHDHAMESLDRTMLTGE